MLLVAPSLNDRMVRVDNKPREWLLVLRVLLGTCQWGRADSLSEQAVSDALFWMCSVFLLAR